MDATHFNIASADRAVLVPEPASLLRAVRALARIAGPHLLVSCVVDDHVHAVISLDRREAGPLVRRFARALRAASPVELAPAHFRPVESRAHLVRLVGYLLDQPRKHGLQGVGPVALWPGSCFVDLVGARVLDGFDPRRLASALPRLARRELFDAVGLPEVAPLADDELRAEGPRRVGDAAAAAVGTSVLEGRDALVVRARRAAARLCRSLGFADAPTGFGLRCPRTTASRLARAAPPDPALDRAIRLQLALRRAAAGGAP